MRIYSLILLVLFVLSLHILLDNALSQADCSAAEAILPSAQDVRLVALGFDKLIADCYWLSFISYYGDTEARLKDNYALADDYLELITCLDPDFVQPYWFAAFCVGNDQKNPQRAAEILERGISANQNNWYLPFIAGFNQYMFAKNELGAAKYYRQASKYPGAPDWLERQAKILEAKIPSTIKEINTWTDVYQSVSEEGLRQRAKEKLIGLWMSVYSKSPSEEIRKRARAELSALGVDLRVFGDTMSH